MAPSLPMCFAGPGTVAYVTNPDADAQALSRTIRKYRFLRHDTTTKRRALLSGSSAVAFGLLGAAVAPGAWIALAAPGAAALLYYAVLPRFWRNAVMRHPDFAPLPDVDPRTIVVAAEGPDGHARLWAAAVAHRRVVEADAGLRRAVQMHAPFDQRELLERAYGDAHAKLDVALRNLRTELVDT